MYPCPDSDKGHPLVGLTRISISVPTLGEETSSTLHLSLKTIEFENQVQVQIQGFFLGVKDEEIEFLLLSTKKLSSPGIKKSKAPLNLFNAMLSVNKS